MTREAVRRTWQKRLRAFSRSSLTQREWCGRNGLALHQFTYWKRQLEAASAPDVASTLWCPVQVLPAAAIPATASPVATFPPAQTGTGVVVRIGNARIEVEPNFDPATLRAVVCALEATPC